MNIQAGETPLSIAERLGLKSAIELLKPVTSRQAVPPQQPVSRRDATLLSVEPETMFDPVSLDSEDETGMCGSASGKRQVSK